METPSIISKTFVYAIFSRVLGIACRLWALQTTAGLTHNKHWKIWFHNILWYVELWPSFGTHLSKNQRKWSLVLWVFTFGISKATLQVCCLISLFRLVTFCQRECQKLATADSTSWNGSLTILIYTLRASYNISMRSISVIFRPNSPAFFCCRSGSLL